MNTCEVVCTAVPERARMAPTSPFSFDPTPRWSETFRRKRNICTASSTVPELPNTTPTVMTNHEKLKDIMELANMAHISHFVPMGLKWLISLVFQEARSGRQNPDQGPGGASKVRAKK